MQKKILIYNSGGGLGDSIQLFPLILSLKNHFKGSEIYYLGAHENHYNNKLKEYNITLKTLDINIQYFGFRWWHLFLIRNKFKKLDIDKFDLIIDLQSKIRNTIILRTIPHKIFYSSTFKFIFCSIKNSYISNYDLVEMTLKNLSTLLKINILKINYTLDKLPILFVNEAKKLLPNNNYIGFSITQGNAYRKKSWPIEKLIILANKIKEKNKFPVFFVEKNNYELINKIKSYVNDAIFPELDTELNCPALVTALGCRLEKAISIDNGIMHMLSLSNVPMIVLFGPTNSKKFAPNKKEVTVIDSKTVYKSDDISKISIEDVFKNI